MKLPASLTISRPQGGPDDGMVKIAIYDSVSNCQVCELTIEPAAFCDMLTGSARQPCEATWRPQGIGKKTELKSVHVPRIERRGTESREETGRRAIAPFEVDGWTARYGDYGNMHRFSHKGSGGTGEGYSVTFTRLVELTPEALEAEANRIRAERAEQ